jgi:hypothetical protein
MANARMSFFMTLSCDDRKARFSGVRHNVRSIEETPAVAVLFRQHQTFCAQEKARGEAGGPINASGAAKYICHPANFDKK